MARIWPLAGVASAAIPNMPKQKDIFDKLLPPPLRPAKQLRLEILTVNVLINSKFLKIGPDGWSIAPDPQ